MTRKNKKFLAHTGDRGTSEISCKTLKGFVFLHLSFFQLLCKERIRASVCPRSGFV